MRARQHRQPEHDDRSQHRERGDATTPTDARGCQQRERGPADANERRDHVTTERENHQRVEQLRGVGDVRVEVIGPVDQIGEPPRLHEPGGVRLVVPEGVVVGHAPVEADRDVRHPLRRDECERQRGDHHLLAP